MSKEGENHDSYFQGLNFDDKTIKSLQKIPDVAARIKESLTAAGITALTPEQSALVYSYFSTKKDASAQDKTILSYLSSSKIKTKQQLKMAEEFLSKHGESFDAAVFDKHIGVGVEITDKEILDYIVKYISDNLEKLKKVEYKVNHPDLLSGLKDGFPLANPTTIIKLAGDYIKEKFGAELKEAADTAAAAKKLPKKKEEPKKPEEGAAEDENTEFQKIDISKLVARDLADSLNSEEILKKHRAETGGKVITRFPPEPNGILHIGHARAIRFNFSIAGLYKGDCNLRYDDTNPEKEKKEYMDMIEDNVQWMGYKPTRVVHASHYFPQIYEWTLELIKKGKAYTCKLPVETLREYKEKMIPSPYRDNDVETNLKEFELMKCGYYAEGEIVLRAKIDYKSPHTTMRDPVLYRIIYTPHPVTGSKWCIYPMYDYAHPLSDTIENITHSCCTLEFETRRDLYYWPLKELNLYRPFVWEFSRLNMTYTLTSKRKILQLIADNVVHGWDDPRLYTINGLRRRGIPIEAMNEFLDRVPVTRRGNDNFIQLSLFEHVLKSWLDTHCPRSLAVSDPVHLEITNLNETSVLQAPLFPNELSKGTYPITLEKHVYVEKNDVRTEDAKGFFGIAPTKIIRIKYGPAIKITSVSKSGNSFEVKGETISEEEAAKLTIKGVLNWVSKSDALKCEMRMYEKLFIVEKPELDIKDAEARKREINPNSLTVLSNAIINKGLAKSLKKDSRLQFERLGYFSVDYDTDFEKQKFVFNRILETQAKKKESN